MSSQNFLSIINNSSISQEFKNIAEKVYHGHRISNEEGVLLFEKGELGYLATLANYVREKKHGNFTFFNRNFHIEPTNICVYTCNFCSYSRLLKEKEDGWELTSKEMMDIVRSYDGKPVTEVHIVGGVHPKLNLDFFCDLIQQIKAHRPDLHVKAFTAVELHYMFKKAHLSVEEGLKKLKNSGMDSMPGGGAEIFDEGVRNIICADKCTSEEWLEIHRTAHLLGIPSNVTMLYGHIENFHHRIDHLDRIRTLQDETKGFNTFIPLKFRNGDNDMSNVPESSTIQDLRNYAVSRIYLDNVSHLKAYWPMIGRATASLSLAYGVDDLDGTINDTTKIYTMAGAEEQNPALSTQQLVELIKQVGRHPIERDTVYNILQDYQDYDFDNAKTSELVS
jgi:aminodeoxyfutalosine synthase